MKQLYTALFLVLSSATFGQSSFFITLGQDTGDVRSYLESRTYVRELYDEDASHWRSPISRSQNMHYLFHDGLLYAQEDQRMFADEETAEHVSNTCIEYLKLLDYDSKELEAEAGEHFVAVTHDRVIEFITTPQKGSEQILMTLRVTSRRYGPRMQTERFVSSLASR